MLLIGLGTGRCGTVSLSKLLDIQDGCCMTHEKHPMPWTVNKALFERTYKSITSGGEPFIGDVAFYHLPYINFILEKTKEVKFVVLKRPKEEVVVSYMKKTIGMDHWRPTTRPNPWDICYPTFFHKLTKEEAIGFYWDLYYEMVEDIPQELCYHMETKDLNDIEECKKMLKFCGFSKPLFKEIKENQSKF